MISHYHHPNIWIGPHRDTLLKLGALYSYCSRTDKHIMLKLTACTLVDLKRGLGCCELTGIGAGKPKKL